MIIENSKTYNVNEVDNLFFRPSFCGKSADELGIRVIYNMPLPTKVPSFDHNSNILKNFSSGWQGNKAAQLTEIEVPMSKLKAENAYSAESYFASVYEMLTNSADVNLGDLTGTDLEKAETELFRRSIAESVYATMWFGDEDGGISDLRGFNGFIRRITDLSDESEHVISHEDETEHTVIDVFREVWSNASDYLRSLAADGNLTYFVSSDIYDAYQFYLDDNGLTNVLSDGTNSRPALSYHGIPVMEIPAQKYNINRAQSFCILTDKRNLILALNTADSPEKEIHMWYNPDEMENRQRVVFLAGTAIADTSAVSAYIWNIKMTFNA